MSCGSFGPPFNGADPAWVDGCGFFVPCQGSDPATPATLSQGGSFTIPKNADRVTVIFNPIIPIGTDYDLAVWAENENPISDPSENIFPTQILRRVNNGSWETGFICLLNSPPQDGPGTFGPLGENSYTKFRWKITYTL